MRIENEKFYLVEPAGGHAGIFNHNLEVLEPKESRESSQIWPLSGQFFLFLFPLLASLFYTKM